MSKTHLIVPDAHAKPGVSNRRFGWLGKLINDIKPDVVINIGDWFDMESLSSYDKGKKSFEGRRFEKDILAGQDAINLVHTTLLPANRAAKGNIRYEALLGNHEQRLDRMVDEHPELDGKLSNKDFGFESYGWNVTPFLDVKEIDGVNYCHYFTSGNSSMPIGGMYPAANLLRQNLVSCTVGHNHLLDFSQRTSVDGRRVMGLSVGCFFEHQEKYATPQNNARWWRGLVVCRGVDKGQYDPEFISMKRLKQEYN